MSQLIRHMQLRENDCFIDLGSSDGRILVHVMLMTPVKTVIGIELQASLHSIASEKIQCSQTELPIFFHQERLIQLIHQDFLTADLTQATVIFISSVCFKQETLFCLAKKLNQLPHLRTVFSLKPLTHFTRLPFHRAVRIQCSWGTALCYCYGAT